ncbi:hypothetical protein H6P81_008185 [Aristolochia fimbriata]|uniref:Exostosin GT47 domain-containing protein n=1 Tax=Aristolochia fimbriata TaxID=158543 RepID=A0AAV7F619_ARIFI|nr:hypothetical protein H6P81_008185 [Aristolochia fimbriata]
MAISTVFQKRAGSSQAKKAAKESALFHLLVKRSIPVPPIVLLLIMLTICRNSTRSFILNRTPEQYLRRRRTHHVPQYHQSHHTDTASIKNALTSTWTTNPDEVDEKKKNAIDVKRESDDNVVGNSVEDEIEIAVNAVKEQMRTFRSSSSSSTRNINAVTRSSSCDGRGVFVYNLPPKFNTDLVRQCWNLLSWVDFCAYLTNDAMGDPIPELCKGRYNNHQYSLEPVFHSRILNHPCRVNNSDEARLFYVPFYGGIDVLRWHFKINVSEENPTKLLIERQPWHENDVEPHEAVDRTATVARERRRGPTPDPIPSPLRSRYRTMAIEARPCRAPPPVHVALAGGLHQIFGVHRPGGGEAEESGRGGETERGPYSQTGRDEEVYSSRADARFGLWRFHCGFDKFEDAFSISMNNLLDRVGRATS